MVLSLASIFFFFLVEIKTSCRRSFSSHTILKRLKVSETVKHSSCQSVSRVFFLITATECLRLVHHEYSGNAIVYLFSGNIIISDRPIAIGLVDDWCQYWGTVINRYIKNRHTSGVGKHSSDSLFSRFRLADRPVIIFVLCRTYFRERPSRFVLHTQYVWWSFSETRFAKIPIRIWMSAGSFSRKISIRYKKLTVCASAYTCSILFWIPGQLKFHTYLYTRIYSSQSWSKKNYYFFKIPFRRRIFSLSLSLNNVSRICITTIPRVCGARM